MSLWRAKTVVVVLSSWAFISLAWASFVVADYEDPKIRLEGLRSEEQVAWLYDEWLLTVDRTYEEPGERERRFEIFKDNLRYIDEHNHPKNNHTYTLGLNELADLSHQEYQAKYLIPSMGEDPLFSSGRGDKLAAQDHSDGDLGQLPDSIDWRTTGSVSPVIHQRSCGSCWAWTATGAVEGLHHIRTGQMIRLSAQQLVDCDSGSLGCAGGWVRSALIYIQRNGGIDSLESYPYTNKDGVCRRNSARVVSINGWREIFGIHAERELKNVAARQPVGISMDAAAKDFQLYQGGVFNGNCTTKKNHAMLLVGYGSENGQDYWLVKNSWGFNWGENGFVKIVRNINSSGGKCGIARDAVYPIKH